MNEIVALGGVSTFTTRNVCFMGENEAYLLGLRNDMAKDAHDMKLIARSITILFEKENREWIIAKVRSKIKV